MLSAKFLCAEGHFFDADDEHESECEAEPVENTPLARRDAFPLCSTCAHHYPLHESTPGHCLYCLGVKCVDTCGERERDGHKCVQCGGCDEWFHTVCVTMPADPKEDFVCQRCSAVETVKKAIIALFENVQRENTQYSIPGDVQYAGTPAIIYKFHMGLNTVWMVPKIVYRGRSAYISPRNWTVLHPLHPNLTFLPPPIRGILTSPQAHHNATHAIMLGSKGASNTTAVTFSGAPERPVSEHMACVLLHWPEINQTSVVACSRYAIPFTVDGRERSPGIVHTLGKRQMTAVFGWGRRLSFRIEYEHVQEHHIR